jgi:hypothetical protein
MIKATPFYGDPTLAIVEAETADELQRATGSPIRMEKPGAPLPFVAIVPAENVSDLLNLRGEASRS